MATPTLADVTTPFPVKRPEFSIGDMEASEIAVSIAVSCQAPAVLARDRSSCTSTPDNLDKLCGPSARERRSPKASRRKILRRRSNPDCHTSLLDLSALDFSLASVDDDEVEQQAPKSSLRIGLNERDVSSKGIENLSRALTLVRIDSSRPLVELKLAYNQLRDEGVGSLMWAAMQGSLTKLQTLVLTANRLRSMRSFSTALSAGALPELRSLILSSNQITASGLADLAGARLADGTGALFALSKFNIDHNRLGEGYLPINLTGTAEGVGIGLAAPSPRCSSARALDMLVRTCTSLTVLDLSANNLTDEDLAPITNAVHERTAFSTTGDRIARLDLMLNCYTLDGLQSLQAACAQHGRVFCPS